MPKRTLRESMLARRRELSPAKAREAGLLAQRNLIASSEFASAEVVAIYAPVHNEVDTKEVMRASLAAGKTLLYPVVVGSGLEFRRVCDPDELRLGAFGILEPGAECPAHPPEETELIVIPGVAFDLQGKRIGYGKGYYDRTLHRMEGNGRLAALCYDFQLVDSIVGEPHDVVMDMIITDLRVIRPKV